MALEGDRLALQELLRGSNPSVAHKVQHYVYLPTREGAAEVGALLRARGFETTEEFGADGINWLVLAKHEIVPSEEIISATRTLLEEIAERYDGEYDGWEGEVQE